MYYKLSDYAKKFGCCYRTAWNRFHSGKIDGAYIDETGHVRIPIFKIEDNNIKRAAIYSRVSNHDAKDNLERQMDRITDFAIRNGYEITNSVKEIGSGLNDSRPKLSKLFDKTDWDYLIIEHKDRLTRFGFNYIEKLLLNNNKKIIVINKSIDDKTDLLSDLVSIIYSFSARIYGMRKAKNKKKDIVKILKEE